MTTVQHKFDDPELDEQVAPLQRVLIVDDSRSQRKILSSMLSRWDYDVVEADSGEAALEICADERIDLIISDWMMPGMNGLEFCKAFRALEKDHYGYFILLTSKSEKKEVAHGLDVGADDFLAKPVSANEFRARIRAGERILFMEKQLSEKNRLVTDTLEKMSDLYDTLDRDLIEARNLQQSLVSERFHDFGAAKASLLLRPCGHIGGDLVGTFPISKTEVGLFAIDVSGHGVASAMMTARLASYFSGKSVEQNIVLFCEKDGVSAIRNPSDVARQLNRILLEEMETEHYFTMGLAHLNLETGEVTMAQCGHPHSLIQRADGKMEMAGSGGLPIGLIAAADWEDFHFKLHAGDRVLIASDGITECPDPFGIQLEEEGLIKLMRRNARLRGNTFFETLMWDLTSFAGQQEFPDDISAVLLEYEGKG